MYVHSMYTLCTYYQAELSKCTVTNSKSPTAAADAICSVDPSGEKKFEKIRKKRSKENKKEIQRQRGPPSAKPNSLGN